MHVPRVYQALSGRNVLVMEFITGALLSDVIRLKQRDPERLDAWLQANGVRLQRIAGRLFRVVYRQIFEHNFFHGDLHTGNIILLKNGHFAIIDCRSVGSQDQESLTKMRLLLQSLAKGEFVTAAEIYFLLSSRLPRTDLNRVKEELVRLWRVWSMAAHVPSLPYENRSLTYILGAINGLVREHGFAAQWSFSKMTGTWVHLDVALKHLDPELNYLDAMQRYFRGRERRTTLDELSRLPERTMSAAAALRQLPDRFAEYHMFQETLMRRQAQVVQGSSTKVDALFGFFFRLGGFTIQIGLLIWLGFFLYLNRGWSIETLLGPWLVGIARELPPMNLVVWFAGFAGGLILWQFCRLNRKRFSQREFGNASPSAWGLEG
jgi:ubiquinone biosynthesis protein